MKIGKSLINSIPFLNKPKVSPPAEKPWVEPNIVRNRPDANQAWGEPAQVKQAVTANLAKEASGLSKLSEAQQQQYQTIVKALPASDPDARQSLQNLLFTGRLPGAKDSQGKGDLLSNLAGMVNAPMQPAIAKDRGALLGDLIQEIDDPSCLAQKGKGTCGATTTQIILANERPAEYVRLMTGLASPRGEVLLQNGDRLKRVPGTETDDGSERTVGTRLMAPAFMEYGNGVLGYDNQEDGTNYGVSRFGGLMTGQQERLLEGVLGRNYQPIVVGPTSPASALLKKIAQSASPQTPVPISLTYGGDDLFKDGHYVQVTGVKDGQVTYINPWGRVEKMSQEQLQAHLMSAFLPGKQESVKDSLENTGNTVMTGAKQVGKVIEQKLPDVIEEAKGIGNWISKHLPWN